MRIDVSFPRWKQLTALMIDESDSYDAVIGRLLDVEDTPVQLSASAPSASKPPAGAYFKGVLLPDGTQLKATYKGRIYMAAIQNGVWVDSEAGVPRNSPSEAAYAITKSGVNGWLFWLVKRPSDSEWQSLSALRTGSRT